MGKNATLQRIVTALLESEIVKNWSLFKERTGTSLLKIRFLEGTDNVEGDNEEVDCIDLNSDFHFYRKNDARFNRDVKRALNNNMLISTSPKRSENEIVLDVKENEQNDLTPSECLEDEMDSSQISKKKRKKKKKSPKKSASVPIIPGATGTTSAVPKSLPLVYSTCQTEAEYYGAAEGETFHDLVVKLTPLYPELEEIRDPDEKVLRLKRCLDEEAMYPVSKSDCEPPSDFDEDTANESFDEPDWNLKRYKHKLESDKDYYCNECEKSAVIIAVRGWKLAYCLKCSKDSGSEKYICSRCYSRWNGVTPHHRKKCLLNLVDLT